LQKLSPQDQCGRVSGSLNSCQFSDMFRRFPPQRPIGQFLQSIPLDPIVFDIPAVTIGHALDNGPESMNHGEAHPPVG
jgi:hypothetical protein